MYAWEIPFQAVVKAARAYEMRSVKRSMLIRSVFLGFMLFTERSILFFTILTLILTGSMITATTVCTLEILIKMQHLYNVVLLFTFLNLICILFSDLSDSAILFHNSNEFDTYTSIRYCQSV